MPKTKVLITVKTYPAISKRYEELVCTAGFREDGTWIRIYPIQFRKKPYDQQYSKIESHPNVVIYTLMYKFRECAWRL